MNQLRHGTHNLISLVVAIGTAITSLSIPAFSAGVAVEAAGDLGSLTVVGGRAAISDQVMSAAGARAEIAPVRQAGENRYQTAAAVAHSIFPTGVDTVYVATADGFADALSTSTALASDNAALLLTAPNSLPSETAAALSRLKPNRVVAIGGSSAISDTVLGEIRAVTAANVHRISGLNRYSTSAEVSAQSFPNGASDVFLATGTAFADALTASSALVGKNSVLLLTDPNVLPAEIADELRRLKPSRIYVIGGTAAISARVSDDVRRLTGVSPFRLAGSNRYDTGRLVSEHVFPEGARDLYLATGQDFPDALSAAQAVIARGAALLLTEKEELPPATGSEIARIAGTDYEGPAISSLTVSKSSVSPGESFVITARVQDPSGVEMAGFWFELNGAQRDFCGQQLTLTGGTAEDGIWTMTCVVPPTAQSGDYTVIPYAKDSVGNWTNTNCCTTSPTRASFSLAGGSDDQVGPAISSLTVSKSSVSPGESFVITARVQDPSGVEMAGFWFELNGAQRDFCGQQLTLTGGTAEDGIWTMTCVVPPTAQSGDYTVIPYAKDSVGNWTNTNCCTTSPTRASFVIPEP